MLLYQASRTAHVPVERKRHIVRVAEHGDESGLLELVEEALSDFGAI